MRRFLLLVFGALLVCVFALGPKPFVPPSFAATASCDAINDSLLCQGLIEWWKVQEATDATRYGAFRNTALVERDGYDVAQNTTYYKFGSASASFTGNGEYLLSPRAGSVASYMTFAVWVKQTTQTGVQYLLKTSYRLESYSGSGHYQSAGENFQLTGGKPKIVVWQDEDDAGSSYTAASAISANVWHLVVYTISPYGPYGKAQGCVSVDGGAFGCGNLTYNRRSSTGDLMVGPAYIGYIGAMGLWSRVLTPYDVESLYYSDGGTSGAGREFPFTGTGYTVP